MTPLQLDALVAIHGGMTRAADLARKFGSNRQNMRQRLASLAVQGLLVRVEIGWGLTSKGEDEMRAELAKTGNVAPAKRKNFQAAKPGMVRLCGAPPTIDSEKGAPA